MTGSLFRIDIRGRAAALRALRTAWDGGPRTYLGLAVNGFPNLFTITGPGSPSVLTNMMPSIEQHVEWVTDCIEALRDRGAAVIEAERAAQDDWVGHVNDLANASLRSTCSSWYLGANVPGKPRVFMPYIGGYPAYAARCADVAAAALRGVCDQVTTASAARRLILPPLQDSSAKPGHRGKRRRERPGGGWAAAGGIRHVMKCHGSDAEHSLEPRRSDTLTITY